MRYFKGLEINDKVWSLEFGWGIVGDISYNEDDFLIFVRFEEEFECFETYTHNGIKLCSKSRRQTLFWDEIKFNIPERPIIKLYENKYEINPYAGRVFEQISPKAAKKVEELFRDDLNTAEIALKNIKIYVKLLALRDQECKDSRGYNFQNSVNNFYIFKENGFYNYSIHTEGEILSCIYFKTEKDVKKICDILNNKRFNLEGENYD